MGNVIKTMCSLNEKIFKVFPCLKRSSKKPYEEMHGELKARDEEIVNLYKGNNEQEHYTGLLHIEQTKVEPLYLTVKNKSSYEAVFKDLIGELDLLKQAIETYLNKQHMLPEDVQKPVTHLIKNVEMFQKRLEMAQQVNDSNFVRTSDYREAAREKFTYLFREHFISKCMQIVNDGLRVEEKKPFYLEIGKLFNAFLAKKGIYTKIFKLYDEIDFELLIPEAKKSTNDEALNGRIADLYMLPYFFNDSNYQGHALISEGICAAYSTQ